MNITRVKVELRRGQHDEEGFKKLLSAFNRAVEQCRIVHECKDRQYYEKPSEKRRKKIRQREYQLELELREKKHNGRRSKGNSSGD